MRSLYPSQAYAASKARRLRRIRCRATPELAEAFAAGDISLRQFDILSRRGAGEQRARITRQRRESEASLLAARTIEEILDRTKAADAPVHLTEITAAIRYAVQIGGRIASSSSASRV
jgi:hypothetical protein